MTFIRKSARTEKSPFPNLPVYPPFQAPILAQPTQHPGKDFPQAPLPIKLRSAFLNLPAYPPFPSTNPSPADHATSNATSRAVFQCTPARQKLQALSPTCPPTAFSQHLSRCGSPGNLIHNPAITFPEQRHASRFASTFPNFPAHPLFLAHFLQVVDASYKPIQHNLFLRNASHQG